MAKELILIGAGKFARETVWMLERLQRENACPWKLLGYVDDTDEKQGTEVYGYPVLGKTDLLLDWPSDVWAIMPMGSSQGRARFGCCAYRGHRDCIGRPFSRTVPVIGKGFMAGEGCLLCEQTLCTVDVHLGRHTIINVGSTISHDTVLGDFVTVSPGVTVCGNCRIGDGVFSWCGRTVIEQIQIGPGVVVGAGATVVKDLIEPGVYVGTPARRIH